MQVTCPNCQTLNRLGGKFCLRCGAAAQRRATHPRAAGLSSATLSVTTCTGGPACVVTTAHATTLSAAASAAFRDAADVSGCAIHARRAGRLS